RIRSIFIGGDPSTTVTAYGWLTLASHTRGSPVRAQVSSKKPSTGAKTFACRFPDLFLCFPLSVLSFSGTPRIAKLLYWRGLSPVPYLTFRSSSSILLRFILSWETL